MTNTVYLTLSANETLRSLELSDNQVEMLHAAMAQLEREVPAESRIVYPDGSASGGLRELDSDGLRILFRYDSEKHAVMVADLLMKAASAQGAERELAATV